MMSLEPRPQDGSLQLREYLGILRNRRWSILAVTAAGLLAALLYSSSRAPVYSASVKVFVNSTATANQIFPSLPPNLNNESQLVVSTSVGRRAAKILGDVSVGELLSHVSVSVPANTQIMQITYSDADPRMAQRAANAFATAYLGYKTQRYVRGYTQQYAFVQSRISKLTSQLVRARRELNRALLGPPAKRSGTKVSRLRLHPNTLAAQEAQSRVDLLTNQLAVLQTQVPTSSVQISPAEVVERARVPGSPSNRNRVTDGVLGMLAGLFLGLGLALLRERLQDRLRDGTDLEQHLGVPTLAVIRGARGRRSGERAGLVSIEQPRLPASEAYRTLRTNVMFLGSERGVKTLMVTCPGTDEGKTAVAANLAAVLAQAGKRVVVVSGDLRDPQLHRFFDLDGEPGLANVLSGDLTLGDALRNTSVEGLRLLPAGDPTDRPTEMLQSEQMGRLVGELRTLADFVVVDAAPTLGVADALVLVHRVDGVLLVADSRRTTHDGVDKARDHLTRIGGTILGGVLNDLDRSNGRTRPLSSLPSLRGREYRSGNGAEPEEPAPDLEQPRLAGPGPARR